MLSKKLQHPCIRLPIWICLKLAKVVDRAQQSGCNEVFPASPGLGGTWILDFDELVRVYCWVAIFGAWEVPLWDKHDDRILDGLRV
jgi:hypothetical protein